MGFKGLPARFRTSRTEFGGLRVRFGTLRMGSEGLPASLASACAKLPYVPVYPFNGLGAKLGYHSGRFDSLPRARPLASKSAPSEG